MDQKDLKLKNLRKTFFQKLLISLILFQSCGKVVREDKVPMKWSNFDLDLPDGIEVYEGTNDQIPLKAWVAKVDLSKDNIFAKVLSSSDQDQLSTPLQFLNDNGAKIIINGGFFNSKKSPVEHVGLLKTNGKLIEPASHSVFRDSERYFISRGAFGIKQWKVDIAGVLLKMIQFLSGKDLSQINQEIRIKLPFQLQIIGRKKLTLVLTYIKWKNRLKYRR